MYTNDKYKIQFIHIPKTGGVSIIKSLSINEDGAYHQTPEMIKSVHPDKWKNYFKFTFVRNPWDRFVSAYCFYNGSMEGFDSVFNIEKILDYLKNSIHNRKFLAFIPQMYWLRDFYKNSYEYDFIGRYENINNDFKKICDVNKINSELKYLNKTDHKNYREYYSEKTKNLVGILYEETIDYLKYVFLFIFIFINERIFLCNTMIE